MVYISLRSRAQRKEVGWSKRVGWYNTEVEHERAQ